MYERKDLFDFMLARIKDVGSRSALEDPQAFGRWFVDMYFQRPHDVFVSDGSKDGKVDLFFTTDDDTAVTHHVLNCKFTRNYNAPSPVAFYDEVTRMWQAFENKPARQKYLAQVVRPELRPRYRTLFDRYDAGAAKLAFLTNHRKNENQVSALGESSVQLFHLEDLLQFMVDHIEEAMPRTPTLLLTGINAVLAPDRQDTEVPTSIVFARLIDFVSYMRKDPFGILFARNVRLSLGNTEVNKEIRDTFRNAAKEFVFSNNGITMLCEKHRHDPGSHELLIENPRVVNGSQTLHSIRDVDRPSSNARVMVRIIEIPPIEVQQLASQVEKRKDIIHKISTRTNRQNPIKKWNLVSNDDFQTEVARLLRGKKIFYERRAKEWSYRKTELRSVGVKRGPSITGLTQLIGSYYWNKKHLGPWVAKGGLGDLFEDEAYDVIKRTAPETVYQIYELSLLMDDCLKELAKKKKYIRDLRRHVDLALFAVLVWALQKAGASWGEGQMSRWLEEQNKRIFEDRSVQKRWDTLTRAGVDFIRRFYRQDSARYRRSKGKPLTLVNFFKAHTYLRRVFAAPLPVSVSKSARVLIQGFHAT